MKKLMISVLMMSLLAACSSQKTKESATETKPAPIVDATARGEASSTTPGTSSSSTSGSPSSSSSGSGSAPSSAYVPAPAAPVEVDPLNDPNSMLAKRSTYYPFDVYTVQDADKPVVQAHAQYLSGHANRKVRLEGNCDERGSNEYNLALGQRRADGVKKMLVVGGAKDSQLEAISYGEEKPKATCHEEKCWKENRRTDLNYNAR